jgi:hypothetical protein
MALAINACGAAVIAALALPDRLGGVEEGLLNVTEEPAELAAGFPVRHQLIREGTGMAEVDQQGHFL